MVTFLDRLYTAKRKVEKRIAILGGQDDSVRISKPSCRGQTLLSFLLAHGIGTRQ